MKRMLLGLILVAVARRLRRRRRMCRESRYVRWDKTWERRTSLPSEQYRTFSSRTINRIEVPTRTRSSTRCAARTRRRMPRSRRFRRTVADLQGPEKARGRPTPGGRARLHLRRMRLRATAKDAPAKNRQIGHSALRKRRSIGRLEGRIPEKTGMRLEVARLAKLMA